MGVGERGGGQAGRHVREAGRQAGSRHAGRQARREEESGREAGKKRREGIRVGRVAPSPRR